MDELVLEAFIDSQWQRIGEVRAQDQLLGFKGRASFTYDLEYLDRYSDHLQSNGHFAASLCCPLNYGTFDSRQGWPAFLLDILPSGAARQSWLKRLDIEDGPRADWRLLKSGAINPPGHLRVENNYSLFKKNTAHAGFDYSEVSKRGMDFIDYAEKMGALVSGGTGAQGVAPKFLLTQNQDGRWHADGAISDQQATKWWIVKFPRGKKNSDYRIIETEASYYAIAKNLDVYVHGPLKCENDNLYIPRFDRQFDNQGKVIRLGLESLTSAAGISDFGKNLKHEEYLKLIAKFSTNSKADILEYAFRDFLNIVCGNTDNHGRNTAFLKYPDGQIRISPLFDFAPMVLDDSGIARAVSWSSEENYIPDFKFIKNEFIKNGLDQQEVDDFFKSAYSRLDNIPELFLKNSISNEVTDLVIKKYDQFMKALGSFVRVK